MKVDFNNLRKQTAYAYDRLCKKLNYSIKQDDYDRTILKTDPEDLQKDMDELRSCIMAICACYNEGDEDLKDVSQEVKPISFYNIDND